MCPFLFSASLRDGDPFFPWAPRREGPAHGGKGRKGALAISLDRQGKKGLVAPTASPQSEREGRSGFSSRGYFLEAVEVCAAFLLSEWRLPFGWRREASHFYVSSGYRF